MADYRLFVNEERTLLVTLWPNGVVEVARRDATWETWGPPVICREEIAGVTKTVRTASEPKA